MGDGVKEGAELFRGERDDITGDCDLVVLAGDPLSGAEMLGSLRGKEESPIG